MFTQIRFYQLNFIELPCWPYAGILIQLNPNNNSVPTLRLVRPPGRQLTGLFSGNLPGQSAVSQCINILWSVQAADPPQSHQNTSVMYSTVTDMAVCRLISRRSRQNLGHNSPSSPTQNSTVHSASQITISSVERNLIVQCDYGMVSFIILLLLVEFSTSHFSFECDS